MFSADDWQWHYASHLSDEPACPWGTDILNAPCPFHKGKTVGETHFLFLGCSQRHLPWKAVKLTIMGWYEANRLPLACPMGERLLYQASQDPWYRNELCATQETCSYRWYLMLKEIVPGTLGKTYAEQVKMLPPEYEVPLAVEEVAKNILYYKKTLRWKKEINGKSCCLGFGRRLNRAVFACCSDLAMGERRTAVGKFASLRDGIHIAPVNVDVPSPIIGIAASRIS